ncbi:hypothetical protein M758_UG050400 [Ceratodon purpureus]|nr:hypothetical protein M758_UG050400 [Ceratodon purpureus]
MPIHACQVYFVDDPYAPEWKVVRYKIPRSRRITGDIVESSLSAPGRVDATYSMKPPRPPDNNEAEFVPEPVLFADVVDVMADQEVDEEAAYADLDHADIQSDNDDLPDGDDGDTAIPADDVLDDK